MIAEKAEVKLLQPKVVKEIVITRQPELTLEKIGEDLRRHAMARRIIETSA